MLRYRSKGTAGPEAAKWSVRFGEDASNGENRDTQYRDHTFKAGVHIRSVSPEAFVYAAGRFRKSW